MVSGIWGQRSFLSWATCHGGSPLLVLPTHQVCGWVSAEWGLLFVFSLGCKPVGKSTSGCSYAAVASVCVAQDRLCDGMCGRLAVYRSPTRRASLRFSLFLWLTCLMRSKQEWWMSLTGGSFESQEGLASYSSLSWSLTMFQMAAVPSAHVPEWGWWQLRAEPLQGWEDMWCEWCKWAGTFVCELCRSGALFVTTTSPGLFCSEFCLKKKLREEANLDSPGGY